MKKIDATRTNGLSKPTKFRGKLYPSMTSAISALLAAVPPEMGLTFSGAYSRHLAGWSLERIAATPMHETLQGLVYKLRHRASGREYVGIAKVGGLPGRLLAHVSQAKLRGGDEGTLNDVLNKDGIEAFSVEVLDECAEDARAVQRKYIAAFNTRQAGFNLTDGGARGRRGDHITFRGQFFRGIKDVVAHHCVPQAMQYLHRLRPAIKKLGQPSRMKEKHIDKILEAVGGTRETFEEAKAYARAHGNFPFAFGTPLERKLKALLSICDGQERVKLCNLGMTRSFGSESWHRNLAEFQRTKVLPQPWASQVQDAFANQTAEANRSKAEVQAEFKRLLQTREFRNKSLSQKIRLAKLRRMKAKAVNERLLFPGALLWLQEAGFPLEAVRSEEQFKVAKIAAEVGLSHFGTISMRTLKNILKRRSENQPVI